MQKGGSIDTRPSLHSCQHAIYVSDNSFGIHCSVLARRDMPACKGGFSCCREIFDDRESFRKQVTDKVCCSWRQ